MRSEKVEVIVTTNVEQALKDIKRVNPSIQEMVEKVQKILSKIDFKALVNKAGNAVSFIGNKMKSLKKILENDELKIKVNSQEAEQQASQIQKQIDSLKEKVNARKINIIEPQIDEAKLNAIEAMMNALNSNGNAEAIIQNITNAFSNLLLAINNIVQNNQFQNFLNECSNKFREISEKIVNIDWEKLISALIEIGQNVGGIALEVLNGIVNVFKWLIDNPTIAEVIVSIALGISALIKVINIYNSVTEIMSVITNAAMLPFMLIGVAIIALLAIIALCIMHWEDIKNVVSNVVGAIIEFITNLWSKVSFIFEAIWNVISTILGFVWNIFGTVFNAIWNIVSPILNAVWQLISVVLQTIWNIISSILGSVWNIFSQIFNWIWQLIVVVFGAIWNVISPTINKIWETIKFVLEKIQQIWSSIWNTISNVVSNVWNAIWNTIKGIVNKILGGIEWFVNGTIKGINKVLSGISKVANAIGSLIGLSPINLQLSTISLPRLAKGGVIHNPTIALMGEYSGARTNPEIVTPQNIMEETFEKVIARYDGKNEKPMHMTIQYLGKTIFDDTIEYINSKTRRTGRNTIVMVGD